MAFRFEELSVWQRAFKLANEINSLIDLFPKKEIYSLSSQIKRAADSVVLNIALRSSIEVVACLMMAKERKYVDEISFKNFYDQYEVLCKMITKLRNSL